MKKIIIAVIVIGAILLLLPPVVGGQARAQLESGIDAWNLQTGGYAKFAVEDYNEGWFASSAKVRFRLTEEFLDSSPELRDDPEFAALMQPFIEGTTQTIHITHGPVILGENTAGCTDFGNASVVQTLPASGITVRFGHTKFVHRVHQPIREGQGALPDYWLDGEDPYEAMGRLLEHEGESGP